MKEVPIETLKEYLKYDGERLVWLKTCGAAKKGSFAGHLNSLGYTQVRFRGALMHAHRIIFALFHDKWPKNYIDHINGNTSDNRIENLREATNSENQRNRKRHREGHFPGVHFHRKRKKWMAYALNLSEKQKKQFLGSFDDHGQAVKAIQDFFSK